jgi:antitoxin HigA-1
MLPKNRKPTHPGVILLEEFLKPLKMTPRQFAEKLGEKWSEAQVVDIIKGKQLLGGSAFQSFGFVLKTTPHFWEHLQNVYTQWESIHRQNEKGSLKPWKKAQ